MKNMSTKIIATYRLPEHNLIVTELSGLMNEEDIELWELSIKKVIDALPDGYAFKLLVNLYGFKAENFTIHKKFRTIIPELLFQYGYVPGYVKMFPEAVIVLKQTRSLRCIAMANVHQDETKMQKYQDDYSNLSEKYFTDPEQAMDWIKKAGTY